MIVAEGSRRAAIRAEESTAAYLGGEVARCERPGSADAGSSQRLVVELSRPFGGMTMRALLGAEFSPNARGAVTVFEVPFGAPMGFGATAECSSELGRPLVAGLPHDFVGAVLDGLAGDAEAAMLPSGLLRVDRAGFDEMGSSELAFKLAGRLLHSVLDAVLRGADPVTAARTTVSGW